MYILFLEGAKWLYVWVRRRVCGDAEREARQYEQRAGTVIYILFLEGAKWLYAYMLNTRRGEKNTGFYSYLACFMNAATSNMYVSMSYAGLTRWNTVFVFLWLRPRNTWIPIQHVGLYVRARRCDCGDAEREARQHEQRAGAGIYTARAWARARGKTRNRCHGKREHDRGPTGDPHSGEDPAEDPPPEGRATQGTHTEHTQTHRSCFLRERRPPRKGRAY